MKTYGSSRIQDPNNFPTLGNKGFDSRQRTETQGTHASGFSSNSRKKRTVNIIELNDSDFEDDPTGGKPLKRVDFQWAGVHCSHKQYTS